MKDPFMKKFASNLRGFRKIAGYSQPDLAQQVGMSKSTICHYERADRIPDIERASLISQVLGVSLDALIPDAELDVIDDEDQTNIYDLLGDEHDQ